MNNFLSPTVFLETFNPEVLKYDNKNFNLQEDLKNLRTVYATKVPEATIFYCARILEVIVKDAVHKFLDRWDDNLASNLETLRKYSLLPESTHYWTKGLRLLGNDVRHIHRKINLEEAELAIFFLDYCLKWFFCDFHLGPKLSGYKTPDSSLSPASKSHLVEIAEALEQNEFDRVFLKQTIAKHENLFRESFLRNPTLPILLIDKLLASNELEAAEEMLESISYMDDVKGRHYPRFVELKGLYLSRTGDLDEALSTLEDSYYEKYKDNPGRIDDDRIGILAGVYKRYWVNDETNRTALEKSHELYAYGWKTRGREKKSNPYLGINAATTALLLLRRTQSEEYAKETAECLIRRQDDIRKKMGDSHSLNYWDSVTLAEARLLQSKTQESKELYKEAIAKHKDNQGNIGTTMKQLNYILKKKGMKQTAEEFLQGD